MNKPQTTWAIMRNVDGKIICPFAPDVPRGQIPKAPAEHKIVRIEMRKIK